LFAHSTKRQDSSSEATIQRLSRFSSTATSGATTPMTCVAFAASTFSRKASER